MTVLPESEADVNAKGFVSGLHSDCKHRVCQRVVCRLAVSMMSQTIHKSGKEVMGLRFARCG